MEVLILTKIPYITNILWALRAPSTVILDTANLGLAMQLVKSREQPSIGHTTDLLQAAHVRK